ncbi:MAG: translation initiation factor IF-3 [Alphaproteobacteria bacterium]|nr:MAG: translation initiation factor IF-3 [Alphaproteobacteria bacterium]
MKTSKDLVNKAIKADQVSVIREGENLGIMTLQDALDLAYDLRLDLVQVSKDSIPTCKVMDYKDFCFKKNKKNAEIKKKEKASTKVKEIRVSPRIGKHDLDNKIKHVAEFIEKKNKVKIVLKLRGREMKHTELHSDNIFKTIEQELEGIAKVEHPPKQESKNKIFMTMKPV